MLLMASVIFHLLSGISGMAFVAVAARSASASLLTLLASSSVTNPFFTNRSRRTSEGSAVKAGIEQRSGRTAAMRSSQNRGLWPRQLVIGANRRHGVRQTGVRMVTIV